MTLDQVVVASSEHDTYRAVMVAEMAKFGLEYADNLPGHDDPRRRIVDINPRVKLFSVKGDGATQANHYHQRTDEWFYLIQGSQIWTVADVATGANKEVRLEAGQSLSVPRNIAHLVVSDPHTIFVGYVAPKFDPKDTYRYELPK